MKRRDFLKGAAVAAAGAAAAACGVKGIKGGHGGDADSLARADSVSAAREARMPRAYQPVTGSRMKLSWEPYELQLSHPFGVSGNTRTTTPDVQVKIEYDGFTGYGEASMPPYLGHTTESICAFLANVKLGQFSDPFRIEEIMDYVNSLSKGDAPAKAAVDMALHDLFGKLLCQPLWRIWGQDPDKTPVTSYTIGIDTPEVMSAKTVEAADRFKLLKVKVGTPNDKSRISAVRSVSDLPIIVDANQGWSDRMEALSEIYWLKEHGVVMVEQPFPVGRIEDTAWLKERSPLPIFADESVQGMADLRNCRGAFNGVNIKLMKCGGLLKARQMMSYARAVGMKVMLGCMTETSCAVSAAAQLSSGVDFADLDGNLLISNDPFEGVLVKDGRITLNNLPGLGLSIKK
ncbi:MAG: dipeptide epimerase [Bacteroidales bacterium]|nr:dipeptide epimerase [Bacteroidales bacterium]